MTGSLSHGSESVTRGFRRIVVLLVSLVILPTVVLLVVGILMLVFWQARLNLVFGILVVTLVTCLVTGAVLLLVLLHREARLSRLQMDFVSKVSHELRTPLTSIRMFTETLHRRLDTADDDTRLCVEVLQQETARLAGRIERLLDWGRMEAGRRLYERSPDTVAALVADAVDTVDPLTLGDRGRVRMDLPGDLPGIDVDHGAMVDALVNLISNACKYGPPDGEILISARTDGRQLRLSVSDRGIGIPHREHRNVFQKFYRVDERLSSRADGSGLGLAIVRHVVRGHKGRVELESEPGRGSTFTIVLPIVPQHRDGGQ